MKPHSALIFLALGLAISACDRQADFTAKAQAKTAAPAKSAANTIVVELYQSQGCSSCPPANSAVNAIADQPGIIALSFAVTYWDRLGWKDSFADKAYTQRQYDYAHALGNPNVYTPQIVINGTTALTGIKKGELAKSVAAAKALSIGPSITIQKSGVTIGKGSGAASDRGAGWANVWLVRYDPRTHNVGIRSGENSGRTLPHKNIVRSLTKLGEWNGAAKDYRVENVPDTRLKSAILVQRAGAGPIIAAKIIG